MSEIKVETMDVPQPEIEEMHWKVGDGMDCPPDPSQRYVIAQMALVLVDESDQVFELRYYDAEGTERGAQRLILAP